MATTRMPYTSASSGALAKRFISKPMPMLPAMLAAPARRARGP